MTRLATVDDLDAIVTMGRHFIEDVYPTDLVFNAAQIRAFATQLIVGVDSDVYLAEHDGAIVGMLALMAYAHPMSGERIATEVCWWVEPAQRGLGLRLFRAAEVWAVAHGATVFQMIAPSRPVAQFYERVGFKAIETTYQRRVA
jgi:GNAT superfamily N-acetyltransferase